MDVVLDYADEYVLDQLYGGMCGRFDGLQPFCAQFLLDRQNIVRQSLSLLAITVLYGWIFYLTFATASYYLIFDRSHEKHPKFLKNQIRKEIQLSMHSMVWMGVLTTPWFVGEVRGYSKLYTDVSGWSGVAYMALTSILFLFFTDMMIYWIHRWLHHPLLYARIHKPHHRWIVPSPYASHAFHFLDGTMQSIPYHIFVYLVPTQKFLYLVLFLFVNAWTVSIHDGEYFSENELINGAANHTLHHLYFNYNYGQYFTIWDRIGGTYRKPDHRQYDRQCKNSQQNRVKEALELEKQFQQDPQLVDTTVQYLVDHIEQQDGAALNKMH